VVVCKPNLVFALTQTRPLAFGQAEQNKTCLSQAKQLSQAEQLNQADEQKTCLSHHIAV
jgi:hypothetical protein